MQDEISFGRWLQQRRKALDLTQAELARRVGVAADTIHKIETDARRPSKEVAEGLATSLEIASEEHLTFLRFARGESSTRIPPPLPRRVVPLTDVATTNAPASTSTLPVGTVTLLFTDIEGSTQLLQHLGEAYADLLADHRRLLGTALLAAGGQQVDTQGDGMLAVFPRARDALEGALAAQRLLASHSWPEGVLVRTRMALHTGEPRLTSLGYVGLAVHHVGRLCGVAHGGQVLLSRAMQILVLHDLPRGASLRDLGRHSLRGLGHQEHIYQLVAPDLPADFPPLRMWLKAELPQPFLETPYKQLDYYESTDAAIFFGRDHESSRLSALIHAHRLVLMYGASGVGKTSLLLAGAVPRLTQANPPYETIYMRTLEDPAVAIRRVVRRRLPDADLPETGTLLDFLAATAAALGRPLLIMLDQFEEFFLRLSPQLRAAAIAELGELVDARDVPIKMVLSLREDWLAAVSELEVRIPEVFRVRMRILPLTREQARQAIMAPVARLGVEYEPVLVEQLLDDLVGNTDGIMPPQLQLVCSALYAKVDKDERLITLAIYKQLGGPQGVLGRYLADELGRLGYEDRGLARRILEELITSRGTKAVKAGDELALALAIEKPQLEAVLEKLVRARLLRVLERDDLGNAYELTHEYLIREIGLGAEAQQRKQAEELIRQEVENCQRFGTLMATDKLAYVYEAREMLRLNVQEQELLLRTAIVKRHETSVYWLGRMEDEGQRVQIAHEYLRDSRIAVRVWTAQMLSTWDKPIVSDILVKVALNDVAEPVRRQAAISLTRWSSTAVTALVHAQNATSDRRAEALAHILDEVGTLPRLPFRTRLQVLRVLFLQRLKHASNILFFRTLGGGLGAAIGSAAFLAPLAYIDPQSFMDDLGTSSAANVALIVGMVGGMIAGLLGGAAAFGFTLLDILANRASMYSRMAGAIPAGVFLGLMFVLLRLADVVGWGVQISFGAYFVFWNAAGMLIWGAGVFTIPTIWKHRSLLIQTVLAAVATGAVSYVGILALTFVAYARVETSLLSQLLWFAMLLGMIGGGTAFGVGIVDRWNGPLSPKRSVRDTNHQPTL